MKRSSFSRLVLSFLLVSSTSVFASSSVLRSSFSDLNAIPFSEADSIICKDSAGNITTAEYLDLVRAQLKGEVKFAEGATPLERVNLTLEQAKTILPRTALAVSAVAAKIDRVLTPKMDLPIREAKVSYGREITLRSGCSLAKLFDMEGAFIPDLTEPLAVNGKIWEKLDSSNRAFALLSTSLYWMKLRFTGRDEWTGLSELASTFVTGMNMPMNRYVWGEFAIQAGFPFNEAWGCVGSGPTCPRSLSVSYGSVSGYADSALVLETFNLGVVTVQGNYGLTKINTGSAVDYVLNQADKLLSPVTIQTAQGSSLSVYASLNSGSSTQSTIKVLSGGVATASQSESFKWSEGCADLKGAEILIPSVSTDASNRTGTILSLSADSRCGATFRSSEKDEAYVIDVSQLSRITFGSVKKDVTEIRSAYHPMKLNWKHGIYELKMGVVLSFDTLQRISEIQASEVIGDGKTLMYDGQSLNGFRFRTYSFPGVATTVTGEGSFHLVVQPGFELEAKPTSIQFSDQGIKLDGDYSNAAARITRFDGFSQDYLTDISKFNYEKVRGEFTISGRLLKMPYSTAATKIIKSFYTVSPRPFSRYFLNWKAAPGLKWRDVLETEGSEEIYFTIRKSQDAGQGTFQIDSQSEKGKFKNGFGVAVSPEFAKKNDLPNRFASWDSKRTYSNIEFEFHLTNEGLSPTSASYYEGKY